MKRHTVTIEDLNTFVEAERMKWVTFASAAGKELQVSLDGHYRVMSDRRLVYMGASACGQKAVDVYNELP